MEEFIDFLRRFERFSAVDAELISSQLIERTLSEGDYFLEAGKYSNEIGFIVSGVFRIYFYDKDANEIVRYFLSENQFLVDLYSYQNQVLGSEYIQALTPSRLIVIRRSAMDHLSAKLPLWDKTIKKITENALLEKLQNRSILVSQDATTKYLHFLTHHPELANRVPLGYLASYLGIKPQSLSRIRKNISEARI